MASLSIIVPCFNEEENIESFLSDWYSELSLKIDDFEIIIIDDCSTDSSPQILKELVDEYPKLIVLRNEENKKYGHTIIRGIKRASKDYIFWTDSDYSHYPTDFWKLWDYHENYDAVWGIRSVMERDSVVRTIFTVGVILLTLILFQKFFKDPNCAFKLFRRENLLKVIACLNVHPILTTTKIAIKTKQMKLSVKEVPVAFLKRTMGSGSIDGFKHVPAVLSGIKEMFNFRITRR